MNKTEINDLFIALEAIRDAIDSIHVTVGDYPDVAECLYKIEEGARRLRGIARKALLENAGA